MPHKLSRFRTQISCRERAGICAAILLQFHVEKYDRKMTRELTSLAKFIMQPSPHGLGAKAKRHLKLGTVYTSDTAIYFN